MSTFVYINWESCLLFSISIVYAVGLSCVCPETLSMFKGPCTFLSLYYKKENLELLTPVVYCVFLDRSVVF